MIALAKKYCTTNERAIRGLNEAVPEIRYVTLETDFSAAEKAAEMALIAPVAKYRKPFESWVKATAVVIQKHRATIERLGDQSMQVFLPILSQSDSRGGEFSVQDRLTWCEMLKDTGGDKPNTTVQHLPLGYGYLHSTAYFMLLPALMGSTTMLVDGKSLEDAEAGASDVMAMAAHIGQRSGTKIIADVSQLVFSADRDQVWLRTPAGGIKQYSVKPRDLKRKGKGMLHCQCRICGHYEEVTGFPMQALPNDHCARRNWFHAHSIYAWASFLKDLQRWSADPSEFAARMTDAGRTLVPRAMTIVDTIIEHGSSAYRGNIHLVQHPLV